MPIDEKIEIINSEVHFAQICAIFMLPHEGINSRSVSDLAKSILLHRTRRRISVVFFYCDSICASFVCEWENLFCINFSFSASSIACDLNVKNHREFLATEILRFSFLVVWCKQRKTRKITNIFGSFHPGESKAAWVEKVLLNVNCVSLVFGRLFVFSLSMVVSRVN